MNKQTKSLLYNFLFFGIIYFPTYFLVSNFSGIKGFWVPLSVGIFSMVLAPKFQNIKTKDGEKIYMKWLFFKGVREIK